MTSRPCQRVCMHGALIYIIDTIIIVETFTNILKPNILLVGNIMLRASAKGNSMENLFHSLSLLLGDSMPHATHFFSPESTLLYVYHYFVHCIFAIFGLGFLLCI